MTGLRSEVACLVDTFKVKADRLSLDNAQRTVDTMTAEFANAKGNAVVALSLLKLGRYDLAEQYLERACV